MALVKKENLGCWAGFGYIDLMKKLIALGILLSSPLVLAESIELSTGEVLDGKLLDFPKDVTVELPDGTKRVIPYLGISSIFKKNAPPSYTPFLNKSDKAPQGEGKTTLDKVEKNDFDEMDPAKGPFGTPMLTFDTWKKAALADDIDAMANCYVAYRKDDIKKNLKKISKKTRQEMKNAMIETIFTPSQTYYQGQSAIMEVSWTKGLASETQTLKFSLENNKDWKIVE